MKKMIAAALAFLTFFQALFAQIEFEKIGAPPGAMGLQKIMGDQNGQLYALFDTLHVLYRSSGNGSFWEKCAQNWHAATVSPADGDLFGWNENGFFRSIDGGSNWEKRTTPTGLNLSELSLLEVDNIGTIWAASVGGQVFSSSDDGQNWLVSTPISPDQMPFGWMFGTANEAFLFSSKIGGGGSFDSIFVQKTLDKGATWVKNGKFRATTFSAQGKKLLGLRSQTGRLIVLSAGNSFTSDDGGQTWLKNSVAFGSPSSLAQLASGKIWITSSNGQLISEDDGQTFSKLPDSSAVSCSRIFGTPTGKIFGLFDQAIFTANDPFLQNWSLANEGIPLGQVFDWQIIDDQTIWAATSAGVFKTENSGATWVPFFSKPLVNYAALNFEYSVFEVLPDGNLAVADNKKLWLSNAGNWKNATPPAFDQAGVFIVHAMPDGSLVCGSEGGGFQRSTDGGQIWKAIFDDTGKPVNFIAKAVLPAKGSVVWRSWDNFFLLFDQSTGKFERFEMSPDPQDFGYFDLSIDPKGRLHRSNNWPVQLCFSDDFGGNWSGCWLSPDSIWLEEIAVNSAGDAFGKSKGILSKKGIVQRLNGQSSLELIYAWPFYSSAYNEINLLALAPSERLFFNDNHPERLGIWRSKKSTVGSRELLEKGQKMNISPNPAAEKAFIVLDFAQTDGPIFWEMTDIAGRLVQKGTASGPRFFIERRGAASGVFFIQCRSERGEKAVGHIVFD